jgi:carboxypeptidase family protein
MGWRTAAAAILILIARPVFAQSVRGVVLDQTGLPVPGATVRLLQDDRVLATTASEADGTFALDGAVPGTSVQVALEGFETTTVSSAEAARVVLPLARASETATVVAPAFVETSPTAPLLGSHLTAETLARMPSSRLKAKESLPLLPSVVRGADGLLRVGGARPYETPLLLDGFNISDPATGISNVNLPYEAVRGIEVLRDPMAVTYGGLVGGVMQLDSRPGGDAFKWGVQGFIPRPRFTSPGLGRLEGVFPRVYGSGAAAAGRVRYFATIEYDFERIPVPGVTEGTGPDIVETSATAFGRADWQPTERHMLTIEALAFPATTQSAGLSPRRDQPATADNHSSDFFAGVTERMQIGAASLLTIKVGVLAHDARLSPNGSGIARLSPSGWHGNWFAAASRQSSRQSIAATWEHGVPTSHGTHSLTLGGTVAWRRLTGVVTENPVVVQDDDGGVLRTLDFGPPANVGARDVASGAWLRDVWRASDRLEIDGGARIDDNNVVGTAVPSVRLGVRYLLDNDGRTVLKGGAGRFVGGLPLAVEAFGGYPERVDRTIDRETNEVVRELHLQPGVDGLQLPRATAGTLLLERQLTPALDAQIGVTMRRSSQLATLHVPIDGGAMPVRSNGASTYRELLVSIRRTWATDQQLFVSYVRSSARGELNDFVALFQTLDAPLLRPGGMSRTPTDARHRWIAWGTFNLPRRSVVSPVVEVRSGFPYSALDLRYGYFEQPNGREFPLFMALDLVAYKTFTVRKRSADIGVQLFNATDHFNPRDVYAVAGAPRYGQFSNSVGPIVRGFMMVKW